MGASTMDWDQACDVFRHIALHHESTKFSKTAGKTLGTCTKWNRELGEGFIKSSKLADEVFVDTKDVIGSGLDLASIGVGEQVEFRLVDHETIEDRMRAVEVSGVGGGPTLGDDYRDISELNCLFAEAKQTLEDCGLPRMRAVGGDVDRALNDELPGLNAGEKKRYRGLYIDEKTAFGFIRCPDHFQRDVFYHHNDHADKTHDIKIGEYVQEK